MKFDINKFKNELERALKNMKISEKKELLEEIEEIVILQKIKNNAS